jgi:hypothetical protein
MPLSEDEERILQEIAQRFYEDDPTFAREVGETTLYRHTVRRMKLAVFGMVVGIVIVLATFTINPLPAFGGFMLMLVCALIFERNFRKLGKAGIDQLSRTMRGGGLRDTLGGAGRKMKDRYRRKDDEQ